MASWAPCWRWSKAPRRRPKACAVPASMEKPIGAACYRPTNGRSRSAGTCSMTLLPVSDYLGDSAALCDAVVRLRGPALVAELGRIASAVMASPHGQFLPSVSADGATSATLPAPFPRDTPALLQEI